jgi:Zn finger protein HypA/HybF involved in hydrogenase expression
MELRKIREEKAVDSLIALLKEGNYRKATVTLGEIRGNPKKFMELFSYLTEGSRLGKTKLSIKPVRAKVSCSNCSWKGDGDVTEDRVKCPRCRNVEVEVLQGNEMVVHV